MPKTKGFRDLITAVRKSYLGKQVPMKYRKKYGKTYQKGELKSVAVAIAKSRGIRMDR